MKAIYPVLVAVLSVVAADRAAAGNSVEDAELEQQRQLLMHAGRMDVAREAFIRICSLTAEKEDRSLVPKALVSDLVMAANSDHEGVSDFAIRSLALIGPNASSALPVLHRLLERKQHPPVAAMIFGINAVPQIENAIDVIQGASSEFMPSVSERYDVHNG